MGAPRARPSHHTTRIFRYHPHRQSDLAVRSRLLQTVRHIGRDGSGSLQSFVDERPGLRDAASRGRRTQLVDTDFLRFACALNAWYPSEAATNSRFVLVLDAHVLVAAATRE